MGNMRLSYDMVFQQHVVAISLGESSLDDESRQKVVYLINKMCAVATRTEFGHLRVETTADNLQHMIDILEILKSKAK